MRQPESLAGASVTSSSPERAGVASARLPSVPGILTADQVLATGKSIAAMQQRVGVMVAADGQARPGQLRLELTAGENPQVTAWHGVVVVG